MTGGQTDNRALLATIRGRLVRVIANQDSQYAEALFAVVRERSRSWTSDEWDGALAELDASALTIEAFLNAEHARRVS